MKKSLILSLFLICVAAFSMTSCSKTAKPDNTDVITNQGEAELPDEDIDGNKITVYEVTDAQGSVVTDENKKPVTEIAVMDKNGKVITDTEGKVSKPVLPEVTKKPSGNNNNNNSNNSNGNGNNGYNNVIQTEAGDTDPEDLFLAGDDSSVDAFLWFASAKKEGKDYIFDSIKGDSDLVEMTFRINSNAKKGKYEIRNADNNDRSSSFCNDKDNFDVTFCSGTIGVDTEVSETSIPQGKRSFVISSSSGKPGDTVTITGSVKNFGSDEIAAFNTYITYDHDALQLVSIKRIGAIESKGEFASNVKNAE